MRSPPLDALLGGGVNVEVTVQDEGTTAMTIEMAPQ
jgi:hypothetical protein